MDPKIKRILRRILEAFHKDRTLLIGFKSSGIHNSDITVKNLQDLAGGHLFDDSPDKFGITKLEGHKIRAYFQTTFEMNKEKQTALLFKTFKNLLEKED